ncbi:MAG: BrnA antitoxin family protein [Rhizobiaceae bacterium]|nr:BrnA antitoxin family protein [Rhizobiaceae bacterium]
MAIQIKQNAVKAAPERKNPAGQPPKPKSRAGRKPSGKIVVSIRLDPEVVERARATGPGWQARINDALKAAFPA